MLDLSNIFMGIAANDDPGSSDDDCDYVRNNRCYQYRSSWDSYGRWIVVAVVIGVGFLTFFLFAYLNS